jgi:hypothetical protein
VSKASGAGVIREPASDRLFRLPRLKRKYAMPAVPANIDARRKWYWQTSLNWCYTHYVLGILSVVGPAMAAILAPTKDSNPWLVAGFAGVGVLCASLIGFLSPKTEWDNFRNAHIHLRQAAEAFECGLIDMARLLQASVEAERYLGVVPPPPPALPPTICGLSHPNCPGPGAGTCTLPQNHAGNHSCGACRTTW